MQLGSRLAAGAIVLGLLASRPSPAWAIGEAITDIRVRGNARTLEETVRSIGGVSIGDVLEIDTLDKVRERLNTSGLFADVNVYWEPYRYGVRVQIVIKDKFPWAPVPTFSLSPGNISGGLLVGHANLFGRGKRGLVGAKYSNVDSGALIVYDDPALFGSWVFWQTQARFQDQVLPEFSNMPGQPVTPIRQTNVRTFAGSLFVGVAWFRKVRTSLSWQLDTTRVRTSKPEASNPNAPPELPAPMMNGRRGTVSANLTFDFRAREQAVMYGNALGFNMEYAAPQLGGDKVTKYWKAAVSYEQGLRLFRRHNLILRAGASIGDNLPFYAENATNGNSLRGFVYRQFAGDTYLRGQVEYHFPLFSLFHLLDVRGLVFSDGAAIWYRKLPPSDGMTYETRSDGRSFLPPNLLRPGFEPSQDVHASVGLGIRFYLRSVAIPLVGLDFGYGFGTDTVRMVLVVGA
jgi:outer membrane protein insertion porin family